MTEQAEMPKYRSHKVVHALEIAALEIHEDRSATIAPKENGGVRIHHGEFDGQHVGIGLDNTGRTLREALDQSLGIDREARNV